MKTTIQLVILCILVLFIFTKKVHKLSITKQIAPTVDVTYDKKTDIITKKTTTNGYPNNVKIEYYGPGNRYSMNESSSLSSISGSQTIGSSYGSGSYGSSYGSGSYGSSYGSGSYGSGSYGSGSYGSASYGRYKKKRNSSTY